MRAVLWAQISASCAEEDCVRRLHAAGADVRAEVELCEGSTAWL